MVGTGEQFKPSVFSLTSISTSVPSLTRLHLVTNTLFVHTRRKPFSHVTPSIDLSFVRSRDGLSHCPFPPSLTTTSSTVYNRSFTWGEDSWVSPRSETRVHRGSPTVTSSHFVETCPFLLLREEGTGGTPQLPSLTPSSSLCPFLTSWGEER